LIWGADIDPLHVKLKFFYQVLRTADNLGVAVAAIVLYKENGRRTLALNGLLKRLYLKVGFDSDSDL
jgi:hypothetical protein